MNKNDVTGIVTLVCDDRQSFFYSVIIHCPSLLSILNSFSQRSFIKLIPIPISLQNWLLLILNFVKCLFCFLISNFLILKYSLLKSWSFLTYDWSLGFSFFNIFFWIFFTKSLLVSVCTCTFSSWKIFCCSSGSLSFVSQLSLFFVLDSNMFQD